VTAVDAPPGVSFAGVAAGEFVARPRARRLARSVFFYVIGLGAITWVLAARHWFTPGVEVLLAAPVLFIGVGSVGYAVRAARLRVDVDGVRWGWRAYGFVMRADRLAHVRVYRDAIAVVSRRGSTWYLARRDWARFERVAAALRDAGIEIERVAARAPLRAQLQAFGIALDVLLCLNAAGATFAAAVALAL